MMSANADPSRWDTEVVVLSASSRARLGEEAGRLRRLLETAHDAVLRDVAFTLNVGGNDRGSSRLAIVASTSQDLAEKLARAEAALRDTGLVRLRDKHGLYFFEQPLGDDGGLAFVFPGEGSQYPNMLADLCVHFPVVRSGFDAVDRAFVGHPRGYLPSDVIFPRPERRAVPSPDVLWQIDTGAHAVWAANHAMAALMRQLQIRPRYMVGHSMGEHSALFASGIVRVDREEELVEHIRGLNAAFEQLQAAGDLPHGVLMAVGDVDLAVLEALCAESGGALHIALDNCPNQVVLCGTRESIGAAMQNLQARGAICQPLPFERAYHTPWFESLSACLRTYIDRVRIGVPAIEVFSSVTAQPYPLEPDAIRQLMRTQCARRVRFRETVEALYARGVRIFVEVGPKANLSGFIDDTLRGRTHIAIPSNLSHRSGIAQLNHMIGQLAAHGVPMDLTPLYEQRGARRIDLTVRTGAVRPAVPVASHAPRYRGRSSHTMVEHLETMDRFLRLQADVMRGYLERRSAPRPTFVDGVEELVPGRRVVATRRIDPNEDRWILDHVLGRDVSTADPDLTGLPVVPLTISMEILAEVASLIQPGQVVVGMKDVRALRWIALDDADLTVRVVAESMPERPAEVYARIEAAGVENRPPRFVEATLQFARAYPAQTHVDRFTLPDERISAWTQERLYRDGMFHGPAFRSLKSVDGVGRDGVRGTLQVLPRDTLLASMPAPQFHMDPVLLDGAGQLLGFWAREHFESGLDLFPHRVEAVRLYGPMPPVGTQMMCHMRAGMLGNERTRCGMTLVDPQGAVHCEIEGWEDRRFWLPRGLVAIQRAPRQTYVTSAWRTPLLDSARHEDIAGARIDDLPETLLLDHGAIWMKVLACMVLSRAERAFWRDIPPATRCQWLLRRTAAKDAIRRLVSERCGLDLRPADVEVWPDESGRLCGRGLCQAALGRTPIVSVSDAPGEAVAVAALDPDRLLAVERASEMVRT